MLQRALFAGHTPYRKFLILVGLTLISAVIFTIIGGMLAQVVFGVAAATNPKALSDLTNPNVVHAALLIQFVAAIGTFVLPPYLAAYLFDNDPASFLGIDRKPQMGQIFLALALILVAVPFINWMLTVNGTMKLPASLKSVEDWMKQSEEAAARLTEAFVASTSISRLFVNLIVMAILPAIGEELLFRGVIQRLFKDLAGNIHVSIILTAVLFSALHMQFYGFLPRFALGVLLGYLYYWSGSLRLSMAAHMMNNSLAIIFAWLAASNYLGFNQDTIGTGQGEELILGVSVFLSWVLVYMLSKTATGTSTKH